MDDFEIEVAFKDFFNVKMRTELASVVVDAVSKNVDLNFRELERFNLALADELLDRPDVCLKLAAKTIGAMNLTARTDDFAPNVRVYNLPNSLATSELGVQHIDKLLQTNGIVKKIGRKYVTNAISPPEICKCGRHEFHQMPKLGEYCDLRWITILGEPDKSKEKIQFLEKDVCLTGDLTDSAFLGDNLIITGILRLGEKKRTKFGQIAHVTFIEAIHIEKQKQASGKDPGRIDSDVINIGVAKSRIDKMHKLWGVIDALQAKCDLVDMDEIVREAGGIGLDESYVRRFVEDLKRQGDLIEWKVGFVKRSRKKEW